MKCPEHGKELVTDITGAVWVCPVIACEYRLSQKEYGDLFQTGE